MMYERIELQIIVGGSVPMEIITNSYTFTNAFFDIPLLQDFVFIEFYTRPHENLGVEKLMGANSSNRHSSCRIICNSFRVSRGGKHLHTARPKLPKYFQWD